MIGTSSESNAHKKCGFANFIGFKDTSKFHPCLILFLIVLNLMLIFSK
jgi:hypothetical protein